ncbi:MAG: polysaccharide biosynthesis/export family protein [Candidatus Omnitrophica bacterium]|nr:polysaccharide biosynthesis/export family protein [Candidatus Omnitrophota bacterium]
MNDGARSAIMALCIAVAGCGTAARAADDPFAAARDAYAQGLRLYDRGDYAAASERFEQAKTLFRVVPEQAYRRGEQLYAAGRYAEAEAAFAAAKQAHEKFVELTAAFPAQPDVVPYREDDAQPGSYSVRRGDALFVQIRGRAEFSGDCPVNNDGSFKIPGYGAFKAAGYTLGQVEQQIATALSPAASPRVRVSAFGEGLVIINGAVRFPGAYPLTNKRPVRDLIALAGDYAAPAAADSVIIVRGGLRRPVAQRIDLSMRTPGKDDNVFLASGDIVFVPAQPVADPKAMLPQIVEPVAAGKFTVFAGAAVR